MCLNEGEKPASSQQGHQNRSCEIHTSNICRKECRSENAWNQQAETRNERRELAGRKKVTVLGMENMFCRARNVGEYIAMSVGVKAGGS